MLKNFRLNATQFGFGAALSAMSAAAFADADPDIAALGTAASAALSSAKTQAGLTGGQVIAAVVVVCIVGLMIALTRKV